MSAIFSSSLCWDLWARIWCRGFFFVLFFPHQNGLQRADHSAQHCLLFCQEKVWTAVRFIGVEACTHGRMQELVGDVPPKRSSGGWNGFPGSRTYCFRDKKPVAFTCCTGSNVKGIFENKALNNVNYLYIILEIILVVGIWTLLTQLT